MPIGSLTGSVFRSRIGSPTTEQPRRVTVVVWHNVGVSFLYFAYGSNLSERRLRSRCSSARPVGTGVLAGWRLVCDKPSNDGSAKLNIRPDASGSVHGALYEIADEERGDLDLAEPRYTPIVVDMSGLEVLTYTYEGDPYAGLPHEWYVELALDGAREHGLPQEHITIVASP